MDPEKEGSVCSDASDYGPDLRRAIHREGWCSALCIMTCGWFESGTLAVTVLLALAIAHQLMMWAAWAAMVGSRRALTFCKAVDRVGHLLSFVAACVLVVMMTLRPGTAPLLAVVLARHVLYV